MVNYQNGKIYQIIDLNDPKLVYIGSTCQKLSARLATHVQSFKAYKQNKYCNVTVFKVLKEENYRIELLEEYKCDNMEQLRAKEGEWIRKTKCVNKNIAGRTKKQWRNDNKDKLMEYGKQYKNDNKDKVMEYDKQYRKNNKAKIQQYRQKKILCKICNKDINKAQRLRHEQSKKHQSNIK